MSEMAELLEVAGRVQLGNYRPAPLVMTKGNGVWVEDVAGRRFLDLTGGVAVLSVGHAHPTLAKAIADQASRLMHVSNLFHNDRAIALASELVRRTSFDRVYFANSGTEANETLLKLARRYHFERGDTERVEILATEGSFHGRTMGALSVTGQEKYRRGMGPLLGATRIVPFDDLDAMRAAASGKTAAILVEPVQGEGGVRVPSTGYLPGLRALADEVGALLLLDEVQTGYGRTGRFLGAEHSGVVADACALAKGIGGGFPLGAVLVTKRVEEGLPYGSHASTFGGNALACAAGLAVLEIFDSEALVQRAAELGTHLRERLENAASKLGAVTEARGLGPLAGLGAGARSGPGLGCGRDAGSRRPGDARRRSRGSVCSSTGGGTRRAGPRGGRGGRGTRRPAATRLYLRRVWHPDPLLRGDPGAFTQAPPAAASARTEGGGIAVPRHLRSLADLTKEDLFVILDRAAHLKRVRGTPEHPTTLAGKTVVILLDKASTRTRLSFEIGIRELGGHAITVVARDSQLGRGEPVDDTARLLSRYAHAVVYRTHGHDRIELMAGVSSIPIVNGLSDLFHPCQLLADLQTVRESFASVEALRVAWVGDGNNMAHSWMLASGLLSFELVLACPAKYRPEPDVLRQAESMGARMRVVSEPADAVRGAHVVTTDVWASMGQEGEKTAREAAFAPNFCVTEELMSEAASRAIFLHCLPAHRGEEVTAGVIDGPQSVVWDEAENRLHSQKALLEWLFGAL